MNWIVIWQEGNRQLEVHWSIRDVGLVAYAEVGEAARNIRYSGEAYYLLTVEVIGILIELPCKMSTEYYVCSILVYHGKVSSPTMTSPHRTRTGQQRTIHSPGCCINHWIPSWIHEIIMNLCYTAYLIYVFPETCLQILHTERSVHIYIERLRNGPQWRKWNYSIFIRS